MRQRFRAIVRAVAAMCYLTSLITGVVVLLYALLTVLGRVPPDADLARGLGVPTVWLLIAVYLFVTVLVALIWHQAVAGPAANPDSQRRWRWVYRQTDRTGLWLLDLTLITAVLGGAMWVRNLPLRTYVGDGPDLLAALALIPTVVSYLPWRRPRRIVPRFVRVEGGGEQMQSLVQVADMWVRLIPGGQRDTIAADLEFYNELTERTGYAGVGSPLPEGTVLEVPPRFVGEP